MGEGGQTRGGRIAQWPLPIQSENAINLDRYTNNKKNIMTLLLSFILLLCCRLWCWCVNLWEENQREIMRVKSEMQRVERERIYYY